jgi:mRNA interferase MazF
MGVEVTQYHAYLVNLDPTIGHGIMKTRPCIVISPDEMNRHLKTVIIAPMTTKSHPYPSRVPFRFAGKDAWIVLDQIRSIDQTRLIKSLGKLDTRHVRKVKDVIREMLVN